MIPQEYVHLSVPLVAACSTNQSLLLLSLLRPEEWSSSHLAPLILTQSSTAGSGRTDGALEEHASLSAMSIMTFYGSCQGVGLL